jgi:hypothetical protein
MGKRNGRYCCECDFCAAGPCEGGVYCLFLTDDSGYGHTLVCCAHAAIVGKRTRAYLAAHPGVAVDPECADAWAVIEAEREYAARCVVVAAHQATCPNCGAPLPGGVPAQDAPKDVSADRGPVTVMPAPAKTNESWRDRPPLL